ncbi:hypothetical protein L0244_39655 [bacterium]|nr:hypothetical protein [bacterium]
MRSEKQGVNRIFSVLVVFVAVACLYMENSAFAQSPDLIIQSVSTTT